MLQVAIDSKNGLTFTFHVIICVAVMSQLLVDPVYK